MSKQGKIAGANLEEGFAWAKPCNHAWLLGPSDEVRAGDPCPTCKEIAERVKAAEQALASELENPGGEYYTGLRCGIEDRDITDRYEAVEYGWDQAFSYIESILEAPQ